jgi:hypothetical protein
MSNQICELLKPEFLVPIIQQYPEFLEEKNENGSTLFDDAIFRSLGALKIIIEAKPEFLERQIQAPLRVGWRRLLRRREFFRFVWGLNLRLG